MNCNGLFILKKMVGEGTEGHLFSEQHGLAVEMVFTSLPKQVSVRATKDPTESLAPFQVLCMQWLTEVIARSRERADEWGRGRRIAV
jgi:hypothetical protein